MTRQALKSVKDSLLASSFIGLYIVGEAKLTGVISPDSGFHQSLHPLSNSELLVTAGPMRYTQLVCGRYGTHISDS